MPTALPMSDEDVAALSSADFAVAWSDLPPDVQTQVSEHLEFEGRRLLLPFTPTLRQYWAYIHPARGLDHPLLFGGAMGGSKALTNSANVSTPFGWKPIGSMTVGDQVHAADGTVARVIGVWPQGVTRQMRVTFSDGSSVVTNPDHLWLGWEAMKRYKANRHWVYADSSLGDSVRGRLYTTRDIKSITEKAGIRKENHGGGKGGTFLIPIAQPVQYTRTSRSGGLPISPYVLGVLLGDGHISGPDIRFTCGDVEIAEKVRAIYGKRVTIRAYSSNGRCPSYTINDGKVTKKSLDQLGLGKCRSWEKFIPERYIYSSIEDRWELLRGLMDTDGTADSRGHISFTSTSTELAIGVRTLIESLGGTATLTTGKCYYVKDGERIKARDAHTLYIKLSDPSMAFYLSRKRARCVKPQGMYRRIVSVEEIEPGETTCITIDHPTGLFITERMVVTHNSAWLCGGSIRESREIPNNRCFLARRTMVSFTGTTLVELLRWIDYGPQPHEFFWNKNEHTFTSRKNGSVIAYGQLGDENDIQRHGSSQLGWLGVDEATEVPGRVFTMMQTRLRLPQAAMRAEGSGIVDRTRICLTANPVNCWVKDNFVSLETRKDGYYFIPSLATDNPHLDPSYVRKMQAILPPELYRAWLKGDWDAHIAINAVIPTDIYNEAVRRIEDTESEDYLQWNLPYCAMGVDCGHLGNDATSVSVRTALKFELVDHWEKERIPASCRRIATIYHSTWPKPSQINVDMDGLGAGFVDELLQLQIEGELPRAPELWICGVHAESTPFIKQEMDNPFRYANVKAENFFRFRSILEAKRGQIVCSVPGKNDMLKSDLTSPLYMRSNHSGKIVIEGKPQLKQRIGRSPDDGDSMMLTLYVGARDEIESMGMDIPDNIPMDVRQRMIAAQPQFETYDQELERLAREQEGAHAINSILNRWRQGLPSGPR